MAEENGEKQEPVKPEKKTKKKPSLGGGLSLPVIIGAVAGLLVLIAATVIFSIFIASKFIAPQQSASGEDGKHADKTEKHEEDEDEEKKDEIDLEMAEEEEFQKGMVGIHYVKTGRITTNPKGSSQFVVLNLGFEFRMKNKDNEWVESEVTEEDPMVKHAMSKAKGVVNQVLGSMTVEELHSKRSEMPLILKEKLKDTFKKYRILLKDVIIEEFIIQ
jgi:flagellar basal body-associated protein FliL